MTTTSPSTRTTARTGPRAPAKAFSQRQAERVLKIPPPPGRIEEVVALAVRALEDRYDDDLDKAEKTIREHGLTIEATRLRDRLDRSVGKDLDRLLMSTPGVPERLFNKAIKAELAEEEEAKEGVKDESVLTIGERLEAVVSTLEKVASALTKNPDQVDVRGNAEPARRASKRDGNSGTQGSDDKQSGATS